MARLVIVSNRVPSPRERGPLAGGLAVALKDAIQHRETLWFGWSGKTTTATAESAHVTRTGGVTYALLDIGEKDFRGYYQGGLFPQSSISSSAKTFFLRQVRNLRKKGGYQLDKPEKEREPKEIRTC